MNEMLYKHVLFKDLQGYIKRTDYFGGYTDTEKAWIKKNLDLQSQNTINTSLGLIKDLISGNNLNPGCLYTIPYLEVYKLLFIAISNNELSRNALLITDSKDSLFWDIKYDLYKDSITYMRDDKGNEASYDFKFLNPVFDNSSSKGNIINATNIKFTGESNFNSIKGNNIQFNVPVSNLIGELNNVKIDIDEIGLDSNQIKTTVFIDNKYYIDYLDLETLTHLFYALDTIQ